LRAESDETFHFEVQIMLLGLHCFLKKMLTTITRISSNCISSLLIFLSYHVSRVPDKMYCELGIVDFLRTSLKSFVISIILASIC